MKNELEMSLLLYMALGSLLYKTMFESVGETEESRKYKTGQRLSFAGRFTAESPEQLVQKYTEKSAGLFEQLSKNRNALGELALPAVAVLAGFLLTDYFQENIRAPKDMKELEELKKTINEYISANWELKKWKHESEKKANYLSNVIDYFIMLPGHLMTSLFNLMTGSKTDFSTVHGAWLAVAVPIAFLYGRDKAYERIRLADDKLKRILEEGWVSPTDLGPGLAPFRSTVKEKPLQPVDKEVLQEETEKKITQSHKDTMTLEELFKTV